MTRFFDYYDKRDGSELLQCPRCGWTGTFDQAATGLYDTFSDAHCPNCEATAAPLLGIKMYPALQETKQHGSAAEAKRAQRLMEEQEAFWRVSLTRADQLPELPGEEDLTLIWDIEVEDGHERPRTLIRDGERVLFSEPASWEALDNRYESICQVLREKYGARMRDLVPTRRSEMWLYGDKLAGSQIRLFIIARIFGLEPEREKSG